MLGRSGGAATGTLRAVRGVVVQARAIVLLARARRLVVRRRTTEALVRLDRGRRTTAAVPADDALRAVRRAARLVGGDCLDQGVALTALLRRAGRDPILVLGCHRYEDRRWGAHAWVLDEDQILDPRPSGHHDSLAWYRAADDWLPTAPASAGPNPS
jgi:hypothetical protein